MKLLDLFSGIGGFSLGAHAAGWRTVGFCEHSAFCRGVLQKRFPGTPIHDDVRTLHGDSFGPVDLVAGGFPCQDVSLAGPGGGLGGERSGLWWEMHRVIREAHPTFVVAENSPVLRSRGLDELLGGLDALGYDAEWHCLPAGAFGARHRRDRIWIVAYARSARLQVPQREALLGARWRDQGRAAPGSGRWASEPALGRVAHGVPRRVDRLRGLGNAMVPLLPFLICRELKEHLSACSKT